MTEIQVPEEILRQILEYTLWPLPITHWLSESEVVRDEELGGPTDKYERPTRSALTV